MTAFKIIAKIAVGIMLAVQAYSDHKTKELYTLLTYAAIILAAPAMFISADQYDIVYIAVAVMFILLQSKCGAYAMGDAKLYIAALEALSMDRNNIDILISFLFMEMTAIIIFAAYVFIPKIFKREKLTLKEGCAYAPAIFTAYLLSMFIQAG